LSLPIGPDVLQRIVEDPLFFAEAVLIEPYTGKPFQANYVQRMLFTALRSHRRVALRVSRQTGKTYGLSVISLWGAFRFPNQTVLIAAPSESKVKVIFDNIDRFVENNPFLKQSLVRAHARPNMERVFSNGSRITGFTLGSSSNRKGESVRGQGGDVVIVDEAAFVTEEDWRAIVPIIEGGLYRPHTMAVVASTPYLPSGRFYEIFHSAEMARVWHCIHVPVTQNPDFADRVESIRASVTEMEWVTEFLAEFPDAGAGVFRQSDIQRGAVDYMYSLQRANGPVAIGVDWDKYQAGVNIAVCQYVSSTDTFELIYREEVPRTQTVLSEGVRRIIEINEVLQQHRLVQAIYVDRGYGDMQIEMLHQEGVRRPWTNLHRTVVGFNFSQPVEVKDPVTGQPVRKRFKDAILAFFQYLLETGRFRFPAYDDKLRRDLMGYHVVSMTSSGPRYTDRGDHVIDAICLALWALRDQDRLFHQPLPETSPFYLVRRGESAGRSIRLPKHPVPPPPENDVLPQGIVRSFSGAPGAGRGFVSRSLGGTGRRVF